MFTRVRLKPDGTRWRTGGEVKGKLANGVGSQYFHTTSERGVSSITNADAHTSAASSWLNWRPRRFKWTRPFRRKTKSGFCTCAITFQTHFTGYVFLENILRGNLFAPCLRCIQLTIILIHRDTYTFNFVPKTSYKHISQHSADRGFLLAPLTKPHFWGYVISINLVAHESKPLAALFPYFLLCALPAVVYVSASMLSSCSQTAIKFKLLHDYFPQ